MFVIKIYFNNCKIRFLLDFDNHRAETDFASCITFIVHKYYDIAIACASCVSPGYFETENYGGNKCCGDVQ
ncbi:hypothetical protein [Cuspidothrix issatschenkoi]|uniref:hypothetical protein n=1 Tax=Cuspidothrix issatschenkoi TaxID=230752 RepID=UPI001D139988|nr:hypothetical protein [Cuspidothrix issatschenkoi]